MKCFERRRCWRYLAGIVLSLGLHGALGTSLARAETLQRQLLTAYPNAICNDGLAAAFYHSGRASANWVVFLDGGGSCVTRRECDARWIRSPGNMSGAGLPATVTKQGIFARGKAANPTRSWNFVYVQYCSSDEWIGGGGNLASGPAVQAQGAPASYVFRGADIFDATIDHLTTIGIPIIGGGTSVLGNNDQTTVILSGTSAGGKGTMNNVLRLESQLPDSRKYYIVDAYYHGLDDGLPVSDDTPEFPQKTVYAPRLTPQCNTLDCLKPATVHATFQTLGLKVLYGFAERDSAVGGEGMDKCTAISYPYQSTCTGAAGPGAAAQKAHVISKALPANQYAGWHPNASHHVMLTQNDWFYGGAAAASIGGVTYARAVRNMLAGVPSVYVAP